MPDAADSDDKEENRQSSSGALSALAALDVDSMPPASGGILSGIANKVTSGLGALAEGTRSGTQFLDKATGGRLRAPLKLALRGEDDAIHALGNLNVDAATSFIQSTALDNYDHNRCGHCAHAVRDALQSGGLDMRGHPVAAADYIGFLDRKGFGRVDPATWVPQKGDVIVFRRAEGHPDGHIEMDIGNGVFASDFKQKGFYPAHAYASMGQDGFVIYRHQSATTVASASSQENGREIRVASAATPASHGHLAGGGHGPRPAVRRPAFSA